MSGQQKGCLFISFFYELGDFDTSIAPMMFNGALFRIDVVRPTYCEDFKSILKHQSPVGRKRFQMTAIA